VHAAHAAERIELAALEDLYTAATTRGVVVRSFGAATMLLFPGGPPVICNRVLGFAPGASMSDRDIDRLVDFAVGQGLPWAVSLPPHVDPEIAPRLLRRGFQEGYAWMKFGRTADRPPEARTMLRIALATPDDREGFASIVAASHSAEALRPHLLALPGRAGWRCFLAWDGDQPVAAAACFVKGGAAWLGLAATLPSHRRWGAQSALLAARIRDAGEQGAHRLFLETGKRAIGKPDQSYRNILRAGFEELYLRPNLRCHDFDRLSIGSTADGGPHANSDWPEGRARGAVA